MDLKTAIGLGTTLGVPAAGAVFYIWWAVSDTAVVQAGQDRVSGNTWLLPDSPIPNGSPLWKVLDNQGQPGLSIWIGGDNKAHLSGSDAEGNLTDVMTFQTRDDGREVEFESVVKMDSVQLTGAFAIGSLPNPASWLGGLIRVTGQTATGVSPIAWCDGTNWRFVGNDAVVS